MVVGPKISSCAAAGAGGVTPGATAGCALAGAGAAAFGEAAGAPPGWGATGAAAPALAAAGVIGLRAGLASVRLVRALIERMRGLSGGTVFDSGAGEAPGGGGVCARAGITRASAARILRNVFTVISLLALKAWLRARRRALLRAWPPGQVRSSWPQAHWLAWRVWVAGFFSGSSPRVSCLR